MSFEFCPETDTPYRGSVSSLGTMAVDEYRHNLGVLQEQHDPDGYFQREERGFFPQAYFDDPTVKERIHDYMDTRGLPVGLYVLAGFDIARHGHPDFSQVLERLGGVTPAGHVGVTTPLGVHFYEAMCYQQRKEQNAYRAEVAAPAHQLFVEATENAAQSGVLPTYLAKKAAALRPEMLLKDDGFVTIASEVNGLAFRHRGFALFAPDIPPALELHAHIHEQLHLLEGQRRNRWGIDRSLPQHPHLADTLREATVEHAALTLAGRAIADIHPGSPGPDHRTYGLNRYVLHELCSNPDELGINSFIDAAFSDTPPNLEFMISRTFGQHPRILNELESSCKEIAAKKPGAKRNLIDKAFALNS